MTTKPWRAIVAAATFAIVLAGCGTGARTAKPSAPEEAGIPVPILKVGDPFAVDLLGDGQATVTVLATEVSASAKEDVRLVVTVRIVLNKAGNPITGGPENFRFRDRGAHFYQPQTSAQTFAPELVPVNLTTAGQQANGKLFFEMPADSVTGGHIQLVSGRLVHALWKV